MWVKSITITIVNPNRNFLANLLRKIREKEERNLRVKESLDLGYFGMDETIPKKRDFLVPALPLIEEVAEKAKTTDVIEFLAKQRSGSTVSGPTYKVRCSASTKELLANGSQSARQYASYGHRTTSWASRIESRTSVRFSAESHLRDLKKKLNSYAIRQCQMEHKTQFLFQTKSSKRA